MRTRGENNGDKGVRVSVRGGRDRRVARAPADVRELIKEAPLSTIAAKSRTWSKF